MIVCGARGSPGIWGREKTNPKGHILLSDNGGESWRVTTDGLEKDMRWMPWVLLQHPTDTKALFCGMGDGARGFGFDPQVRGHGALYVSRNAGDSWEALLPSTPSILTAWIASE